MGEDESETLELCTRLARATKEAEELAVMEAIFYLLLFSLRASATFEELAEKSVQNSKM